MNIIKLMHNLIDNNSELSIYGGVGYCGYGSVLLHNELEKLNIPSVLIYGKAIANTKLGNHVRHGQKQNILAIDSKSNDLYSVTKEKYIKAGNTFSKGAGHVAVLIGDVIYDITSRQFGLPQVYPYSDFMETWSVVSMITLEINKEKNFYTGDLKIIKKLAVANEEYIEVKQPRIYSRTKETPGYLSW